jgi:hypothetical protein
MSIRSERLRIAPPVAWIVQLYPRDALQLQQKELVERVGGRLFARCNARTALAEFVEHYPEARGYAARMLLIDRLVHAVHSDGGPAARNLMEGRPRADWLSEAGVQLG